MYNGEGCLTDEEVLAYPRKMQTVVEELLQLAVTDHLLHCVAEPTCQQRLVELKRAKQPLVGETEFERVARLRAIIHKQLRIHH